MAIEQSVFSVLVVNEEERGIELSVLTLKV